MKPFAFSTCYIKVRFEYEPAPSGSCVVASSLHLGVLFWKSIESLGDGAPLEEVNHLE